MTDTKTATQTEGNTIDGLLDIGVAFNGEQHRQFTLRLPTVGDEIDVTESGVPEGGFGVALMARCIERLGTIPKEHITYALLRDLVSDDYGMLTRTRDELKKKRKDANGSAATSATPASGSGATATPKATSAPLTL